MRFSKCEFGQKWEFENVNFWIDWWILTQCAWNSLANLYQSPYFLGQVFLFSLFCVLFFIVATVSSFDLLWDLQLLISVSFLADTEKCGCCRFGFLILERLSQHSILLSMIYFWQVHHLLYFLQAGFWSFSYCSQ